MLQTMHTLCRLSDLQSDNRASTTSEADLVISLATTHCIRTEQRAELGLSFPLERLALEDWLSKRPASIELMTCMWWPLKNLNGHNALCFLHRRGAPNLRCWRRRLQFRSGLPPAIKPTRWQRYSNVVFRWTRHVVMERAPRKVPLKDGRRSRPSEGRTLCGETPF